jgi:hypothetical protein
MYLHEASKWCDIIAVLDGITWETQRMTGEQPVFIIKEQTIMGHTIATCTWGSSLISFHFI